MRGGRELDAVAETRGLPDAGQDGRCILEEHVDYVLEEVGASAKASEQNVLLHGVGRNCCGRSCRARPVLATASIAENNSSDRSGFET